MTQFTEHTQYSWKVANLILWSTSYDDLQHLVHVCGHLEGGGANLIQNCKHRSPHPWPPSTWLTQQFTELAQNSLKVANLKRFINSYGDLQHLIRVSCGHLEGGGANLVQRWKGHRWVPTLMAIRKHVFYLKNCKPNLNVITPPPNIPTTQVFRNLNTLAPLSGWP